MGRYDLALGLPTLEARRIAENDTDWMHEAACGQKEDGTTLTHLFFIEERGSYDEGRKICAVCPVRAKCLEWAIRTHQPEGLWGGMTDRQRRTEKRSRQRREKKERNDRVSSR